jgi:hypothetical protein
MDYMSYFVQFWYVPVIIVLILIGTIVANVLRSKKTKAANAEFLSAHPAAAKVYTSSRASITSETIQVYTVNGDHPQTFLESGKTGFYVIPGESTVQASYVYNRPGVIYKNVTTTYGPADYIFTTEPNKQYELGFNRKSDTFTFVQLG